MSIQHILDRLLGHSFQVVLVSATTPNLYHYSFYTGSAWGACKYGVKLAEYKTKKENKNFILEKVNRI